jgi:hypothetical protein
MAFCRDVSRAHLIATLGSEMARRHDTRSAPLSATTTRLHGRALRHATLAILVVAERPLSVRAVLGGIAALGRTVDAPYPAKAVADALRYEVRAGRVRRVRRGEYAVANLSNGMRYRVLSRFGSMAPPVAS